MTTKTHFRTCHLCEAMCGVAIEVKDECIVTIRGDREDPFSRGHICPKALGLKDVHEDPDRIKLPQRRTGSSWQTIGWDEAFDEVATRLVAIQKAHGRNSVGLYQGNPTVHNYGSLLFGQMFIKSLRTRSRFSATSADQLPHMLASLLMFGHQLLLPVPDIDRTDFMLMLGANPLASNGSLMTAPDVETRLRAISARGGRLVVIDPRRTETAKIADQHLFIRPGTDALLLLALLQTIFAEGLTRPGRLGAVTDGLAIVEREVSHFSPARVASAVGVAPEVIRDLARQFAGATSAVCYGRVGVSTQQFGALACWLINVLNLVTGNLDRVGGFMFTRPAADLVSFAARIGQRGHFAKGRSRVRGLPEFGGELPVSVMAEEMETPGDGQIRALVTSAGNPALSAPNGPRIERALERLDFMVSIDFYRNETTRHADILLPPTFALEHDHYDLAFHALAIRNTAKYSMPLFEPSAGAKHDWEIFLELSTRIEASRGRRAALAAHAVRAGMRRLRPAGMLAALLRFGPHGGGLRPGGLTLEALREDPHGRDLGPLEPCLPARLYTPGRRIALAPAELVGDLERLRSWFAARPGDGGSLELIGRRDLRSNNSWLQNSERLVKGRPRCTLRMHPEDAHARGLSHEQRVKVASRVGAVEVALEISDELMPGVVSLPHGWGHDRPGTQLRVAEAHAGVSINDLTDEEQLDTFCGNAGFNGVGVTVEPC